MSLRGEHDTVPPSMDPAPHTGAIDAPTDFWGIVRRLGPGLIIAGSIVGSGELIATTKTGAQAGIALLWLILIGCLIKVFVQIELGRYTISSGETTLAALDQVPGPRLGLGWIVWFWLAMTATGIAQLGGIVGGVGQALALSLPIRGDYADAIRMPSVGELKRYLSRDDALLSIWDLQRLQDTTSTATASESDAELSDEAKAWAAHVRQTTEAQLERLEALNAKLADELRAAAGSLASQQATDFESRRELETLLTQANRTLLEASAKDGDDAAAAEFASRRELEQRRLLRGHEILASQLADLDRDHQRATHAIVAVQQLAAAESELKSAKEQRRSESEIAEAKAYVDYRRQLANLQIEPTTVDDKYWAFGVTLVTIALLYRGRYGLIQNLSTALVVAFTFITIGNVMALQSTTQWHIPTSELVYGLSFRLPEIIGENPLLTALATFGIIGVGASELIAYPYWCLEKGYARFAGARSPDEAWAHRARGWIRVMHYDAFLSMIVYTIATLAFFLMGVAVLYSEGRDPDGMRMVSTLSTAYVPVFGEHAKWLFLGGAFAVLYSTFLVSNAGHSRTLLDVLKIGGLVPRDSQRAHDRGIATFGVLLPLACLVLFCAGINPVRAILIAGSMQALLLPMIGFGALWFRYTKTDERLRPNMAWDVLLIVSFVGLLVAGLYGSYSQLQKLFAQLVS